MLVLSFLFALLGCNEDGTFDLGVSDGSNQSGDPKSFDVDGDSHNAIADGGDDCDDTDGDIYPGALELCDMVDNDCDNDIDDNDTNNVGRRYGPDMDGDTWTDSQGITVACDVTSLDEVVELTGGDPDLLAYWIEMDPKQYDSTGTLSLTDCDDQDATVYPTATEVCDGVDNDCDATTADGPMATWYADVDGDGYGDASSTTTSCESAVTGYVTDWTDCNDGDGAINPAALEMCDYVDNDCDLSIDGSDSTDATTWYYDQDVDGYGVTTSTIEACFSAPAGYAATSTDCDDTDASANPGAAEVCDSVDNDCNTLVDDGDGAPITWYEDTDGDLYGDSAYSATTCDAPAGYVETSGDCDDTNAAVNPLATEVSNGIDDNCRDGIDEGVTCTSEVEVIYSQGDAITITADATTAAFDGAWWNGTTSGVTGVAATEASLGGDYRMYTFTFDMCFVSGTQLDMTGTFDLGGDLCKVDGTGAILRAYEDGTRLTVTSTLDSSGGCYYAVTE